MSAAFKEDFLQRIKNVSWSQGIWLGVYCSIPTPTFFFNSVDIDFPDQAGGTPGIRMFHDNVPHSPAFTSPHKVTAADLKAQFQTLAGAPVTGFFIKDLSGAPFPGPNQEVLIKLDDFFPSSSFRVRTTFTIDTVGEIAQVQVFLMRKGSMKAGLVISQPRQLAVSFDDPDTTVTVALDFRVHPDTMTVDQAIIV